MRQHQNIPFAKPYINPQNIHHENDNRISERTCIFWRFAKHNSSWHGKKGWEFFCAISVSPAKASIVFCCAVEFVLVLLSKLNSAIWERFSNIFFLRDASCVCLLISRPAANYRNTPSATKTRPIAGASGVCMCVWLKSCQFFWFFPTFLTFAVLEKFTANQNAVIAASIIC